MSLFAQKSLLAKLMATEDLIIRQAKVDTASFDIKNRVLTVPILDRSLSKELYDLFMGHETGHALWTPLDGMIKAKNQKVNMSVLNVVEDSRIERKIKNKYPGIKSSFVKAYSELYEKNFFETEGKLPSDFNFIDRINLHCKIGASLALPFTEEEKSILQEIENTETFDEVIEITKKICEIMKEQLQEMQQQQKIKVAVIVDSDGSDENSEKTDSSDEDGEEQEEDFDVVIDARTENSDGADEDDGVKSETSSETDKDASKNEEESKQSESDVAGGGANRNKNNVEEQIRSFTDDAYRKNEKNLFTKGNEKYIYANIPKVNTQQLMDYKETVLNIREHMTVNTKIFNNYRKESAKVVSYLVKEFELRKNADQMKRAQSAKTGELNMNRLYSYNFTDDIFKKITVMPQGKSHGLVMFIDWSGSMVRHLANTVKQLLNLAMFCKKVNIPFDVYCFIESTFSDKKISANFKQGDLHFGHFGLINILSNRMNAHDFTFAASALMQMACINEDGSRGWRVSPPRFMQMSGTPLNEAVIAAMEIVPEFQKRNKLQIVNTVFLTDGEGMTLNKIFDGVYARGESFSHMVIRDPKTRHEEIWERKPWFGDQTDSLIRLLKQRTNSHVIGFFVGEQRDVTHRMDYFFPEVRTMQSNERMNFSEKIKEKFRKDSSLVIESTGFDDYYILRSNGLDTDDDEELTFRENATTRGMVSAFSKYAGNKISSRVILNRFIGLIS